jgi:hypothetical protein
MFDKVHILWEDGCVETQTLKDNDMISIRFCNSSGCELVSIEVPTKDGVDQDELITATLRGAVKNGIFCVGDTIHIVEE